MFRVVLVLGVTLVVSTAAPAARAAAKGGGPPLETFRISGGDLPHPTVVSLAEYLMAVSGQGTWYTQPSGASEPAASQIRYRLDVIDAVSDRGPVVESVEYVPGPPARMTSPDTTGWAEPVRAISDLLDRYILLGKRGLLPERPTLAEALRVSSDALGVSITLGDASLAPGQGSRVVSLLGEAQPVVFGVQGTLVGSRNLHQAQLALRFGEWELRATYVPPGAIAPYGLLLNPGSAGNWEYVALLSPPGYATWAYTVPAELDRLMAGLGFTGKQEGDIVQQHAVPLEQARLTPGIDRIEIAGGDGRRVTLTPPPDEALFAECPGAASCAPTEPFAGLSMKVEVWPVGLDLFRDVVRPAEYVYYAHDASGSTLGVLVMTRQWAYANVGGSIAPPAYAAPVLDAELRAALARLNSTSTPSSRAQLARSLGVGVPAVTLGVLAIAYVSWDAERKRRRSDEK